MTQTAVVTSVPEGGTVLVEVRRQSACAHDCEHCAGCGAAGGVLTVRAETDLELSQGDQVEISSDGVLAYAGLVYLMPLTLALLGYLLPFPSDGLRIFGCIAGFALGLLGVVAVDRRLRRTSRTVTHRVVRKL